MLLKKFECNYSRSGVYTLLDRLNIVWITGRSKHPKSSQEAIDSFKETFPEEVDKIREKIEIWWQDESRVGQQGSLSRVWAAKGTRPRVVRQRQFLSTYILDRAGWHTTEALIIPSNITLFPLPSYSPELNPMEQVWQKLKHGSLSNRIYKSYEEIVDCCSDAWNSFVDGEGNITSLCSRAWADI